MRKLPLILLAGSILASPPGSAQEQPRATASEPRPLPSAGWLKHCQMQKVTGAGSVKACLTYREHVDRNTGAIASVAIHQAAGRQGLMVTMPAWVERAPGVSVQIYPGSLAERNGKPVSYQIPLSGLREAYDGPAVDLARMRKELMDKIHERRKELLQHVPKAAE